MKEDMDSLEQIKAQRVTEIKQQLKKLGSTWSNDKENLLYANPMDLTDLVSLLKGFYFAY